MSPAVPFPPCRFALALALIFAQPLQAQVLDGRFFGGGTVSGFSQACVAAGWSANSVSYAVRYQPAGLGFNGPQSLLSFFGQHQAFAFQIEGDFTNAWQDVEHLAIMDGAFLNTPAHDNPTSLRLRSQNPRVVDEDTTRSVRIRGQVRNFAATTGCTISFEILVQQR